MFYFSYVKFICLINKLGVCNICTRLRSAKILAKTVAERTLITRLMQSHTVKMRADRSKFYSRRTHSGVNPHLQWTILSDSTSGYIFKFIKIISNSSNIIQ